MLVPIAAVRVAVTGLRSGRGVDREGSSGLAGGDDDARGTVTLGLSLCRLTG